MAIIRWNNRDPWGLDYIQNEMNRLFDDWPRRYRERDVEATAASWVPNVDIFEDDGALLVTVELPGMKRDDVDVDVKDDTLTIAGNRKLPREKEKDRYYRIECCHGPFSRTFTLPANIDKENIEAKMDSGLLTVKMPKKEESKARKIKVKVG